jgi:hypothetical protein
LTDISKRKVGFFSHLQSEDKISSEVITNKSERYVFLTFHRKQKYYQKFK